MEYTSSAFSGHQRVGAIAQFLAIFFICAAIFFSGESVVRYVVYAIPLVLAIDSLSRRRKYSAFDSRRAVDVVAMWCVLLYVLILSLSAKGFQHFVLIGWPLFVAFFPGMFERGSVRMLCIFLSGMQIYTTVTSGFSFSEIDILSSEASGETHTLPFVLGLLSCFFLGKKDYRYFFLSFVFALSGGKRIVFLGLVVVIVMSMFLYLYNRRNIIRASSKRFGDAFSVIFIVVVGSSVALLPFVAEVSSEFLDIDVNVLTAGRFAGQSEAFAYILNAPWYKLLLGNGYGMADELAESSWGIKGVLIHCDYLRLICDFGLLAAILFCYLYFKTVLASAVGKYILPYIGVLWVTDNTLIYPYFGFTLMVLVFSE